MTSTETGQPLFTLGLYGLDTVVSQISHKDDKKAFEELNELNYRCIGGAALEEVVPDNRTVEQMLTQLCEDLVGFHPKINVNGNVANELESTYLEDPIVGPHPVFLGKISMWVQQ